MTADPYKWRRRLGRFVVTRHLREDWQRSLMLIQRKLLIRECTVDWTTDNLNYIGQGEMFKVVDEGDKVPLYHLIVWQRHTDSSITPVDVSWEFATHFFDHYVEYREAEAVRDGVALSSITHPGMNADFSGPAGSPTDLERAKSVPEILKVLDHVWYAHDDPRVETAFKRVCAAKESCYRA